MSKSSARTHVLRSFRFVHAWLGILIMPWIIVIGLTGFYLNHPNTILAWIESAPYDETQFATWPGAAPLDETAAAIIANGIWPDEPVLRTESVNYHNHSSFLFGKASGRIIVARETGHYFVKTVRTRSTHAPDGNLLHRRIYWRSILKQLHTDGWLGKKLGSWLADITSFAMVVFGLTGMVLWWLPRARRIKRMVGLRPPGQANIHGASSHQ